MRERVEEVREMVHEEQVSKKEIANGNGYIFVQTHTANHSRALLYLYTKACEV